MAGKKSSGLNARVGSWYKMCFSMNMGNITE